MDYRRVLSIIAASMYCDRENKDNLRTMYDVCADVDLLKATNLTDDRSNVPISDFKKARDDESDGMSSFKHFPNDPRAGDSCSG
jgi:hypothetical protein